MTWQKTLLAIALALCVISCKDTGQSQKDQGGEKPQGAAQDRWAYFHNRHGKPLGSIRWGTAIELWDGNQFIRTKTSASGKVKYVKAGGEVVAKASHGADGQIKLKNAEGQLLWKVKRSGRGIKLADNEAMANAFKIKYKTANACKLYANEAEVGRVEHNTKATKITTLDEQYLTQGDAGDAVGVFAFTEIPLILRLAIIAELAR